MSNLKELIKELQEARVSEILSDTTITKNEKLKLLSGEKLFGYASFIQHEFSIIEDDFKSKHKQNYYIFDSLFSPSNESNYSSKYELVEYHNKLEQVLEYYCEEHDIDLDFENLDLCAVELLYPVLSERYSEIEIFLNFNKIVDIVYAYCINNKIIGYRNDW